MSINFPNDPATNPGDGGSWTDPDGNVWLVEIVAGEAIWTQQDAVLNFADLGDYELRTGASATSVLRTVATGSSNNAASTYVGTSLISSGYTYWSYGPEGKDTGTVLDYLLNTASFPIDVVIDGTTVTLQEAVDQSGTTLRLQHTGYTTQLTNNALIQLSLANAATTPVADGDVLQYSATDAAWQPGPLSLSTEPVIEWTITANGSSDYIFSGAGFAGTETDPAIYVVRGQTYKFTNSMGAHPFQIQSTQGTSGTAYNDGITNNAVSNGTLTWEVRMDAPSTLYYQCTSHADMNGTIYVLDESGSGSGAVSSVNTQIGAVSLGVEDLDDFQLQATPPVAAYHAAKQSDGDFTNAGSTTGGFALDTSLTTHDSIYINNNSPTSGTSLASQGFIAGTTLDLWVSSDGVNFTQHTAANSFLQGGANAQFFRLSPDLTAYSSATALYFSLTSVAGTPIALAEGDIIQYESATSKFRPVQLGVDDLSDVDTSTVAPTDGQALVWDNANSKWEPGTVSGGGGTSLPTAQDGEALIYENGQWVAGPVIGGVSYINGDPNFSSVAALLHFNGVNGSTTFTDDGPDGLSMAASGSVSISTAQSKFGGASGLFPGGSHLTFPATIPFDSDPFTVEAWVYPTSLPGESNIYSARRNGSGITFRLRSTGALDFFYSSGVSAFQTTAQVSLNTWTHVAVTRDSNNLFTLWIDGVSSATNTITASMGTGNTPVIGKSADFNGEYFNGYIDDLRITAGVCRYTANFTAPTAELSSPATAQITIPYSIDKLDDVDTSTVAPTDGQALLWDNTAQKWEPGTVSGGNIARAEVSGTTASIANAASADLTITNTGKAGQLLSIETDSAAWVTVYVSQATRTADASRAETTDPSPGSGVLAEAITTGAQTVLLTPSTMFFNNEATPASELYLKVVNKSGATAAITVTLKTIRMEV